MGLPQQCDYRLQSGLTVCVLNVRGDYVSLSLFNAYAPLNQSQYSIASPDFNAAGSDEKGIKKMDDGETGKHGQLQEITRWFDAL